MAKEQPIKRGTTFKDITGQVFGRLRAIEPQKLNRHRQILWKCFCDPSLGGCGAFAAVLGSKLRTGHTRSCGCLSAKTSKEVNTTHGRTYTAEYRSWYGMKQRCTNPNHKSFPDYGSRGILVCERWMVFENFLADMGLKPSAEYTLERVNNDGNYEPENCVWATRKTQTRNTRRKRMLTLNGQTKCMSEWAAILGVTPTTIFQRLERGWSVERALS